MTVLWLFRAGFARRKHSEVFKIHFSLIVLAVIIYPFGEKKAEGIDAALMLTQEGQIV